MRTSAAPTVPWINGFVALSLAPAPVGEYTAGIWATDGTDTQTDTLLSSYRDRC